MKKLFPPPVTFNQALVKAISGIGDEATANVYTAAFPDPETIESGYAVSARAGALYAAPRVLGTADPVIVGTLRKSHLTKLYGQYFVPAGKPARELYDAIKVGAQGKCPLCGGIGHVRTLDHYLPKANFPLYSVLPSNLVPCCRDCNSEKLNAFSTDEPNQTLHPYFDHDRFFTQKWISARVIPTDPPVVEFFVSPPDDWSLTEKSRVRAHFSEYDLAAKFSVEAGADIPETLQTRRTTMAANTPEEFSAYLAEKGRTDTLPINNWRRVMFSALAEDAWFCAEQFT